MEDCTAIIKQKVRFAEGNLENIGEYFEQVMSETLHRPRFVNFVTFFRESFLQNTSKRISLLLICSAIVQ